jgi:hypothetical protein
VKYIGRLEGITVPLLGTIAADVHVRVLGLMTGGVRPVEYYLYRLKQLLYLIAE